MTDRYKGLTVVLDQDYRSDDAEAIINAIKMVKGVLTVTPSVSTADDYINRERIRADLVQKMLAVVYPEDKK